MEINNFFSTKYREIHKRITQYVFQIESPSLDKNGSIPPIKASLALKTGRHREVLSLCHPVPTTEDKFSKLNLLKYLESPSLGSTFATTNYHSNRIVDLLMLTFIIRSSYRRFLMWNSWSLNQLTANIAPMSNLLTTQSRLNCPIYTTCPSVLYFHLKKYVLNFSLS